MTLQKIKNVYRIENENRSHDSKSITNGLPELYMGIKKGSKKFKKILLKTKKFKVNPWTTEDASKYFQLKKKYNTVLWILDSIIGRNSFGQ